MDKKEVSKILHQIGVMLELRGENPFKARAYYNGAKKIEALDEDINQVVREGRLREIPGIGATLAENIEELVMTGQLSYFEELARDLPEGLFDILRLPGLGVKKVSKLYRELGISNLGELEYACIENRLIELSGFGEKTQRKILKGIKTLKKFQGQYLYANIIDYAIKIIEIIRTWPEVKKAELAGSIRRKKELIKDIDIVVVTFEPEKVMERLIKADFTEEVIGSGPTKTSVRLKEGLNLDLRAVKPDEYVYALHHFTGSKEYNIAMRARAKNMGLKINEYGIFRDDKRIECKDESEFFKTLGLTYIPPELRENMGEIAAAENDELPELITREDIQGVFHVHTRYSDGVDTIPELVRACRERGLKYLGISDHSKTAFYAHGLKVSDVKAQWEEIDALNAELEDFYIFKGIEAEILPDGSLDYSEEILKGFDFVIASIHSNFNGTEEEMTNRLLKAIENPYTTMLGHLTGRLLLSREGYPVDIYRVIRACAEHQVIIELNANPYRLDLDWRYCKYAIEEGVLISINPDAHRISGLDDLNYGIAIGRKGWLTKENVFNALSIEEVKAYLKRRKER
ncbi:histidinol-phosphatase [Anoxybacter fermentans]|uniref:DNA polymerase beta n=1 Tax=Anoxybacter fermentans TaxID=1323375 RepID=A0A3Q9HSL2_9FIRM|nr:DNA polymerase/3'-5' exonuclease PolX [Anoxybacter fermentans]AZR74833.1 histidinol-phosphatase [Anoxybacter fermentans]